MRRRRQRHGDRQGDLAGQPFVCRVEIGMRPGRAG
jgi:hypothetical protein